DGFAPPPDAQVAETEPATVTGAPVAPVNMRPVAAPTIPMAVMRPQPIAVSRNAAPIAQRPMSTVRQPVPVAAYRPAAPVSAYPAASPEIRRYKPANNP